MASLLYFGMYGVTIPGFQVSSKRLSDFQKFLLDAKVFGRESKASVAEQAVQGAVDVRQNLKKVT